MSILYFLIVLLILVLAHEFGHYKMARLFKIKVHEFGFFFPPRILGVRKKTTADGSVKTEWIKGNGEIPESDQTLFSFNALPLGGFVKIKGQGEEASGSDSFSNKSAGQRALVLIGGVLMNIVVAFLIFAGIFLVGAPTYLPENTPLNTTAVRNEAIKITNVLPQSPAAHAGIQSNDTVVSLDGTSPTSVVAIRSYIAARENTPIMFTVTRDQESRSIVVTPTRSDASPDRAIIGIGMAHIGIVRYSFFAAIGKAAETTVLQLGQIFKGIFTLVGNALQGESVKKEVSGPLGIVVMTGDAARLGFLYFLQFTALLSLNLAAINILPFPALDGGHLLFILIEKIRGKKGNVRTEQIVSMVGMGVLLLLIAVITVNDVTNLWGSVFEKFKNLF